MKKPEAFEAKRRARDKHMKQIYKRRKSLGWHMAGVGFIGACAGATIAIPFGNSVMLALSLVGAITAMLITANRIVDEI